MSQLDIALALIGAMVLAVGLYSQAIKRTPVQEPLVAPGRRSQAGSR